jgi:hypothetical protein
MPRWSWIPGISVAVTLAFVLAVNFLGNDPWVVYARFFMVAFVTSFVLWVYGKGLFGDAKVGDAHGGMLIAFFLGSFPGISMSAAIIVFLIACALSQVHLDGGFAHVSFRKTAAYISAFMAASEPMRGLLHGYGGEDFTKIIGLTSAYAILAMFFAWFARREFLFMQAHEI